MNTLFKQFKGIYPRFNELVAAVEKLANEQNLIEDLQRMPDGQIAIQTDKPGTTNWTSGIGHGFNRTPEWEQEFCYLQESLKGSVIEDYISWLGVPVYRTRIMASRPKTCYSIHRDYSPRLHLPLITNKQCNFVFTDPAKLIHMPANGETYWVDTRQHHTFMNGSVNSRLHLVMIVKE